MAHSDPSDAWLLASAEPLERAPVADLILPVPDRDESTRLRLRRPARCATCERQLSVGTEALWYRGTKLVKCLDCATGPKSDMSTPPDALAVGLNTVSPRREPALKLPPVDEGVAGASALRKHRRLHANREDRARAKLRVIGIGLTKLTGDPETTRAWEKGGTAEAHAAQRFGKHLAGSDVKHLHDRNVPGHGSANIDHIAVGPGGVTVIDTKSYKGKVRVERVGGLFSPRREILKINGRDQTRLIVGAEKQINYVESALRAAGHERVTVRGALCMTKVDGLPLLGSLSVRGIMADGPKRVATLARRPGDLPPDKVNEIWRSLAASFPST